MLNALMVTLHHVTGQTSPRSGAAVVSVAQWWVRLTAMTKMFESGDQACPVVIKVSEFSKTETVNWYSGPFYTHAKGYKVCLLIFPSGHGDGKGTHLSVYLCLMKGPHDNELTWPLSGKFEVKLLNQISDCEHHPMTWLYNGCASDSSTGKVTDGNRGMGSGYPQFISKKSLHKVTTTRQYLKDDCIFLQVSKL